MLVQVNEEASQLLVEEYVSMRRATGGIKGAVAAYPRQLESLIRLAEAHAKMRWSHVVEVNHSSLLSYFFKASLFSTLLFIVLYIL